MYKLAEKAIDEYSKSAKSSPDSHIQRARNVFQSILSCSALPPEEKLPVRIAQEGIGLHTGGGETIARVLADATYHILANSETVLPRLKAELATVMVDPSSRVDVTTLEKLPWLVGVTPWRPLPSDKLLRFADCCHQRIPPNQSDDHVQIAAHITNRIALLRRLGDPNRRKSNAQAEFTRPPCSIQQPERISPPTFKLTSFALDSRQHDQP